MGRGIEEILGVAHGVVVDLLSLLARGVCVTVRVGISAHGLSRHLKIFHRSCRRVTGVVAACQPDVAVAVDVSREIAPSSGERLAYKRRPKRASHPPIKSTMS